MLTGPLYKLQVYDSVLSSRSLAIVLVLAAWIALLCMITEIRDCCRTRRMARSGKGFPQALEKPFLRPLRNVLVLGFLRLGRH